MQHGIYIDDPETASYFPSSKGLSSDKKVQLIYWRCVAVCLFAARKLNPDLRLAVFSNVKEVPQSHAFDFEKIFANLNVEFYTVPMQYQTPPGYYGSWTNQFYEFSILQFVANHSAFNENDLLALVDSDCLVTNDLTNLYEQIKFHTCISYVIDYTAEYKINGNSRLDMKLIFERLLGRQIHTVPEYHGGEFLGMSISGVRRLMRHFDSTWEKLMDFYRTSQPRLHEEAHVLSYLYFVCGFQGAQANAFVKRLWTDPTTYRNVEDGDEKLLIWHLPAEKRFGFKRMFNYLVSKRFDVKSIDKEFFRNKIKHTFQVPKISGNRVFYYMAKRSAKTILKRK